MSVLFYNIVSITIGLVLIYFGITQIRKKKQFVGIASFIHSVFFLIAGIGGFFLPEGYAYITILAMLALCITMTIVLFVKNDKKNQKDTQKNTKA